MAEPTCGTCAHWHPTDAPRPPDPSATGFCRRHAPRPLPVPEPAPRVRWPETQAADWCGEFLQRPSGAGPGDEAPSGAEDEPRARIDATLVQKEPIRRGRDGQRACRGLVCITDSGAKLVIWGRDDNMRNLHAVNRARLPCRIAFVSTVPERWSQERYGDTHWVEPDDRLDLP